MNKLLFDSKGTDDTNFFFGAIKFFVLWLLGSLLFFAATVGILTLIIYAFANLPNQ